MTNETRNTALFILAMVGFVLLIAAFAIYMDDRNQRQYKHARETGVYMPEGAYDITEVGNGWQEFSYNGSRFLFYRRSSHESGYACIVRIGDATAEVSSER